MARSRVTWHLHKLMIYLICTGRSGHRHVLFSGDDCHEVHTLVIMFLLLTGLYGL